MTTSVVNFKIITHNTRSEALTSISANPRKIVGYASPGSNDLGGILVNVNGNVKEFVSAPRKRWQSGGGYYANAVVYYPEVPGGPWWIFSTNDADTGVAPSIGNSQWNGYAYLEDIIEYLLINKVSNA